MKEIVKMIEEAEQGNVAGLQVNCNLSDLQSAVLLKILSIYLPDLFIGIAQKDTLYMLARILEIKYQNVDLIELNYLCTLVSNKI